jgi:hypothetical protein
LVWALNLSVAAQFALYVLLLRRQVEGGAGLYALVNPLGKMACAAVPAGFAAWGICSFGDWVEGPTLQNVLCLTAAFGGATAVYVAAAWALRLRELRVAVDRVRARLGR